MAADPDARSETVAEVLTYIPSLRAFALSLTGNRDDAQELLQQALLDAITSIDTYRRGTDLRAWLFAIVRNAHCANARVRMREVPAASASARPVVPPSQEAHVAGLRLAVAINRLPDGYREMLMLVAVLGESYEDAARICGCAVGTVKSRVSRARRMVKDDLGAASAREVMDLPK